MAEQKLKKRGKYKNTTALPIGLSLFGFAYILLQNMVY
jgi:hypothetical protein